MVKLLNLPDIKERLAGGGVAAIPSTPAELAARARQDLAQFGAVIQKANIKPE